MPSPFKFKIRWLRSAYRKRKTSSSSYPPSPMPRKRRPPKPLSLPPPSGHATTSPPLPPAHDSAPPDPPPLYKDVGASRSQAQALDLLLVPFDPPQTLDLAAHGPLLRGLGLWGFVNLDLDRDLRSDLLSAMIESYDPAADRGYVRGVAIELHRSSVAQALAIEPPPSLGECSAFAPAAVVDLIVSGYVVLAKDGRALPEEVLRSIQGLTRGESAQVDWAGLIWLMVKEELMRVREFGACYYASHLQALLKFQAPELFGEGDLELFRQKSDFDDPKTNDVEDLKENRQISADGVDQSLQRCSPINAECLDSKTELKSDSNALKMDTLKDLKGKEVAESLDSDRELNLDSEALKTNNLKDLSGNEQTKKDGVGQRAQHCNVNTVECLDSDSEEQEIQPPLQNSGEFRLENMLDLSTNTPLYDLLTSKLHIDENVPVDLGNSTTMCSNFEQGINGFDDFRSIDLIGFDKSLKHVQSLLNNSRSMFVQKEFACRQVEENNRSLLIELQRRNEWINVLKNAFVELARSKAVDVYRLERELCVSTELVNGYKRACKETQSQFAEYRARVQVQCEPLYRDVPGSGGLVLSVKDYENLNMGGKLHEKQKRAAVEEMVKTFQKLVLDEFEFCLERFNLVNDRLRGIVGEAKMLKEVFKK